MSDTANRRSFVAAYRFQLTPDDDFDVAARLVPYLRALGVSHLYVSPIAEAEHGSRHGYDITDPTKVRDELGGAAALDRLCAELERHDLGLIIDIVPNHLSIATPEHNPWFWDVLRFGTASEHAAAFDIDWDGADGNVVLPVLTQPLVDEIPHIAADVGPDGPIIVLSTGMRLPISEPIDAMTADEIEALLVRQPYRLVRWQSTTRNQRRFFEIDSLAGVAVEDETVRRDRHALLAALLDRWPDVIDGVRVDHVDGLAHPDEYLRWLRHFVGDQRLVLIEKILVPDEELPDRWPVDGTTGYEFARLVDRLLTDDDSLERMRSIWADATGERGPYEAIERLAIEEVLADRLRPEVERIHRLIADDEDLAGERGEQAIVALITSTGRYRTYLPYGGAADVAVIRDAAVRAGQRHPGIDRSIDRLADTLTAPATEIERDAQTLFQQLTGPALAKGGEDRALYRHLPVAALNEVGGDPDSAAAGPTEFHRWGKATATSHPRTLLTTSTHDTKRSGDVRARLLALAKQPTAWQSLVATWLPRFDLHPADTLLLLQSTIGAWPITEERLGDYLIKAFREAAVRSSWIEPDADYETTVTDEVARALADRSFVSDIDDIVALIEPTASFHTLTQTLLRLTAPGFGDLYRGDEIRNLSLVDPDNRRPLDWNRLATMSASADELDLSSALEISLDLAKLVLIKRTLACRRSAGDALDYEPVAPDHAHLLAFRRGDLLVVVDLGTHASAPSGTIALPEGEWMQVLTSDPQPKSGSTDTGQILDRRLRLALLRRRR